MINLRDKKIGLVLSGGGAKGAYQVGMFRALEEFGIVPQISVMSGCSIGAYAETIYALKGCDAYRDFLYNFPGLMAGGCMRSAEEVDAAKAEAMARGGLRLEELVSDRRFWRFEAEGLHRYVSELVADGAVERCGLRLSTCCYSLDRSRPLYFWLNDLSDEEKATAIIGSGSLQYLLRPQLLRGHWLLDGGLVPAGCADPAPPDKIPLPPMIAEDVDFILVNFLIAENSVNTALVPKGVDYLELRPSKPLEAAPGAGTLDFSPEKLQSHEALGYADTMQLLKENVIL